MTKDQHKEYIDALKAFQEKVAGFGPEDLLLTAEELDALESLDEDKRETMERTLSQYIPQNPEYDYRRAYAEKAIAVFILDVMPIMREAYLYGEGTV